MPHIVFFPRHLWLLPGLCLLLAASGSFATLSNSDSVSVSVSRPVFHYSGGRFVQPLLVVRVGFADSLPSFAEADIHQRFFGNDASVRHYFLENSWQQFRIEPATLIAENGIVEVTLPFSHPDFGRMAGSGNSRLLAENAIADLAATGALDDLGAYDRNADGYIDPNELAIVLVLAGYEQAVSGSRAPHPNIWAHQGLLADMPVADWFLSSYAMLGEIHDDHLATIGIMCHELGHLLFALPDLNDGGGLATGVGRWGLMGLGGWNSEYESGDRPADMLAWSRVAAGFGLQQETGHVQIDLDPYRHGDYLLLEYRPDPVDSTLTPVISRVALQPALVREGASVSAALQPGVLLSLDSLLNVTNTENVYDVTASIPSVDSDTADGGLSYGSHELLARIRLSEQGLAGTVIEEPIVVGRFVGSRADEIPDSGWQPANEQEQWLREFRWNENQRLEALRGIDIFLLSAASLRVEVLDNLSGPALITQEITAVQPGWKRILSDQVLNLSARSHLLVRVSILQQESGDVLATSRIQSGLSVDNWLGVEGSWEAVDRSLLMALLVNHHADASDTAAAVVTVTPSATDAGSSVTSEGTSESGGGSGGGYMTPAFVMIAAGLCGCLRRRSWWQGDDVVYNRNLFK
jgi:immune inhibitor A